jgi:hypothetical protein
VIAGHQGPTSSSSKSLRSQRLVMQCQGPLGGQLQGAQASCQNDQGQWCVLHNPCAKENDQLQTSGWKSLKRIARCQKQFNRMVRCKQQCNHRGMPLWCRSLASGSLLVAGLKPLPLTNDTAKWQDAIELKLDQLDERDIAFIDKASKSPCPEWI